MIDSSKRARLKGTLKLGGTKVCPKSVWLTSCLLMKGIMFDSCLATS